jgi:chromate transporter
VTAGAAMACRDRARRARVRQGSVGEVFAAFLRQGLTAFGGPVAHLGYFREDFVSRRKWLSEAAYADIVAMAQFLPGPASSQVGMALGMMRAGWPGMVAAWIAFTLPSALAMALFAWGAMAWGPALGGGWLSGLMAAAVAVVALAVLGMARTLTPDRVRASLAVAAAVVVLMVPGAVGQVAVIVLGGVFGLLFLNNGDVPPAEDMTAPRHRGLAIVSLVLFAGLLVGLPLAAAATGDPALRFLEVFYRAGSLVFGGGHVVLPLLEADLVGGGFVGAEAFLAGYGAAQAVPGPLFTFASYLGAAIGPFGSGALGAGVATVMIFLPSLLMVGGVLPFWDALRRQKRAQAALRGINAAVVGLLLAALYDPVFAHGVRDATDFAIAAAAFLLLFMWKLPAWLVVVLCAVAGAVVG